MTTPDPILRDRLMLAAGFLAGSEMPDCALAVLQAYRELFGEFAFADNSLAAAIMAKLQSDLNNRVGERKDGTQG